MKYFEFGQENPELMVMLPGGGVCYRGAIPIAEEIKTRMQGSIPNTGTKTDTGGTGNALTGDSGRSWVGSSAGSDLRCGHP
ncbi:hypothetical protein RJD28_14605 [Oscillospiraceae bacterium NTUH-002-81]|nr:hypothetical protein RJD28_14605 [Oscillospiraceae bacterium NTUH-002-81]